MDAFWPWRLKVITLHLFSYICFFEKVRFVVAFGLYLYQLKIFRIYNMSYSIGVCVLIRSLANGGAEKQSILLTKALSSKYRTYLVVLDKEPLHPKHLDKIQQEQLNIIFLRGKPWQKFSMFTHLARSKNISVLFSFLPSDTLLAAAAGRYLGIRYIFGGLRNAYVPWRKRIALRLMHNYLLDYSISNCHSGVRSLARQGFKKDKFLVIHNTLESRHGQTHVGIHDDKVCLITVGRFVDQKNHTLALQLFKKLKEDQALPDIWYTLVGYGPREQQIRLLIQELGLKESVNLVINPDRVDRYLQTADIYLSTSLFEGLSNAIMEGMDQGLPVVATRVGDNDYLIDEGVNGFSHDIKDEKGMLHSLKKLVIDKGLRRQMGNHSKEIIEARFSFTAFQQKYVELIEQKMMASHETA